MPFKEFHIAQAYSNTLPGNRIKIKKALNFSALIFKNGSGDNLIRNPIKLRSKSNIYILYEVV
jgi:hypothetical protein